VFIEGKVTAIPICHLFIANNLKQKTKFLAYFNFIQVENSINANFLGRQMKESLKGPI